MPETLPILRNRRDRRLTRQRLAESRRRNLLLSAGTLLSLFSAALILIAVQAYVNLTRDLPSIEILPRLLNPPDGQLLQPTRLYDRSGTHLLYTFAPSESQRGYLPLAESNPRHIPKVLADAIVAVADPNFWTHAGYSPNGIENPEFHPTIAQRLATDLLLYAEAPTRNRALRERLLAAQITARFGRTQVLEWYLNTADFGRHAYGADPAAQLYFGKSAADLTLAETAMLAGIIDAPALNPMDAPSVALQRGREVVRLLAALNLVDQTQADNAMAENPDIRDPASSPSPLVHDKGVDAFVNLALAQLETKFARARIERGGLRVITSMDYDLQQGVVCATEAFAFRLAGQPDPSSDCDAATWLPSLPPGTAIPDSSVSALILDLKSGQVLAVAGETIHGYSTPLLSPHDAGSSLDTFVYLTGFTRGLSPASLVWDIPSQVDTQNFDGQYHGPIRLRIALANGYRVPAEIMKNQMGFENVTAIAKSFGISFGTPVSLLKLAGAFGIFGTQGVYLGQDLGQAGFVPVAVSSVEDLDHSTWLDWSSPQSRAVVTSGLAYLMTNALSDESARWPSLGTPNVLEMDRPAAMKLGQNSDGLDAWTIGYTPERAVIVWSGTNSGANLTPRLTSVLFSGLMEYVSQDLPQDDWPIPPDVTTVNVCDPSGLLPGPDCPNVVQEVFLSGNEPQQLDNLYRKFSINRETGLLATVFTTPQLVEERLYLLVPPEARAWAQSAGVPIPPDTYDAIQPPVINPQVRITTPALFAEVSGQVKIIGSASGEQFASYRLLAGKGLNPQEWIEIGRSEMPVMDGLLAEWDTHALTGLYALQLVVARTDQRLDTAVTQVTVVEEGK